MRRLSIGNAARRRARRRRGAAPDRQPRRPAPCTRSRMPSQPRCGAASSADAVPVVLDRQPHSPAVARHAARAPGGAGVAGDVGQRLLHHAVEHHFDLRREAAGWRPRCRAPRRCASAPRSRRPARAAPATSPRSSSADGRSRLLRSRTCASARPTIAPASVRPSSSSSIFTAVSTCPASSCSSRAMRRRSSSCTRSISRVSCSSSGGARRQPIALVAEHDEQQPEADGEEEQHVGEHAVEHRRAEAAQQRVVEMVQAPQDERPGQHRRGAARDARRDRARTRRRSRCVTDDSSSVAEMPADHHAADAVDR